MNIQAKNGSIEEVQADVLVLPLFSNKQAKNPAFTKVDAQLDGLLAAAMKEESFSPKKGKTTIVRPASTERIKRVVLMGLGEEEKFTEEGVREMCGSILSIAKQLSAKNVVVVIPGLQEELVNVMDAGKAAVEGLRLAAYTFGRYRKQKKTPLKTVVCHVSDEVRLASFKKGMKLGEIMSEATIVARDLVNTPGEHMRPKELVDATKKVLKGKESISIKVYDQKELKKMGAGGVLGVSQGSDHPPYLVHMIYKPKGKAKKKVALVGKAVTFDTGGLSLKPADAMLGMKVDMAGSAAVIGAFSQMDQLAPNVEVHGIFAACENMVSGRAIRPGDVLTIMNKKTVEVLNTDAEGRLTLADALTFANKQKPDAIIDLATLTGACVVALGEEISGIMSNNEELVGQVKQAAEGAGEKMWQLPLEERYKQLLKSDVADYKNLGGRWGGALTAGLFLQEFAGKTPWVHIDIAGPSYAEKPMASYMQKGATGHATRTLLEFLRSI